MSWANVIASVLGILGSGLNVFLKYSFSSLIDAVLTIHSHPKSTACSSQVVAITNHPAPYTKENSSDELKWGLKASPIAVYEYYN